MHMDIQCRGVPLNAALTDYVRHRLAYALLLDDDAIVRVHVRLEAGGVGEGGPDARCCIEVWPGNAPRLEIEDRERELTLAIDRAAQRLGRALGRHLAQRHERGIPLATHAGGDMTP